MEQQQDEQQHQMFFPHLQEYLPGLRPAPPPLPQLVVLHAAEAGGAPRLARPAKQEEAAGGRGATRGGEVCAGVCCSRGADRPP